MAHNEAPETFRYQPLAENHIRLLTISKHGEDWTHELIPADLASAPEFSALSYTWDGQQRDRGILVNGSVLKVLNNIKIVLPYLFDRYPSRCFWIDGICINQEDVGEKGVQVPLMRNIYSQAKECIVWLGESNESIDRTIDEIPMLLGKLQGYDFFNLELDEHSLSAHDLPPPKSPIWTGLNDLLSRGWFSRVWTFQEAVLPGTFTILCGRRFIEFEHLLKLSQIMDNESGSLDTVLEPIDDTLRKIRHARVRIQVILTARRHWHLSSELGTTYTFLDLLYYALQWSCYDPSDKIYGLVGLADPTLRQQLAVGIDYQKPAKEVYVEFARCWIPRDPHLQLLHMVSFTPNRIEGLPTWCPDFSSAPAATLLVPELLATQYRAGIGKGVTPRVSLSADSPLLHVEGFRVGEVAEVLPCPYDRQAHTTDEELNKSIVKVLEWESQCLRLSQRTYDSEDVPDAHWQTLVANRNATGGHFVFGRESYHLTKAMMSHRATGKVALLPGNQDLAAQPLTEDQRLKAQNFGKSFGFASPGRSFFSTRCGKVGLGPKQTKTGDLVCIFYNGHTPYIVRPKPEHRASKTYEFIGDTYVDGLMDGQALKMVDRDADEIFILE